MSPTFSRDLSLICLGMCFGYLAERYINGKPSTPVRDFRMETVEKALGHLLERQDDALAELMKEGVFLPFVSDRVLRKVGRRIEKEEEAA